MKRRPLILFAALAVSLAGLVAARNTNAQIIVDHQPTQAGGPGSDTQYVNMFGFETWAQVADDFELSAPATAHRLIWYAFYDRDNPPSTETFRVRLYGARPGDGLPDDGNIVYEQFFLDPTRVATGRIVFVSVDPREFRFEIDLPAPLALEANLPYWLEIVQIGDIATAHRWEYASAGRTGFAYKQPGFPDWTHSVIGADLAFQLLAIPEPSTLFSGGLLSCLYLSKRRRSRVARRD
ncbi:MAG: hypothetical protein L6Q92_04805 [Phycisphaerae bacterium]|nr:hypothetical protein [Phycisphaerae bacterium]